VKCSDPQVARRRADHTLEPRLHFARGFVGERYGQDAIRSDLLASEQQGNAVRKHARFAASGTGEYQNGTVGMFDGLRLYIVESFSLQDHHPEYIRRE
jgi:hypothetical protein